MHVVGSVMALDGSAPVGTITVLEGDTVLATAEVTVDAAGLFKVKLPKLPAGVHLIRTTFDGGDGFADSASLPVPLLLW